MQQTYVKMLKKFITLTPTAQVVMCNSTCFGGSSERHHMRDDWAMLKTGEDSTTRKDEGLQIPHTSICFQASWRGRYPQQTNP
jgi:hypothetical protein